MKAKRLTSQCIVLNGKFYEGLPHHQVEERFNLEAFEPSEVDIHYYDLINDTNGGFYIVGYEFNDIQAYLNSDNDTKYIPAYYTDLYNGIFEAYIERSA